MADASLRPVPRSAQRAAQTGAGSDRTGSAVPPTLGLRILQGTVIVLGVLLLLGFMGFGYALMERAKARKASGETRTGSVAAPAAIQPFDPTTLDVPAGMVLSDMRLDGSSLALHLTWKDGAPGGLIWIYDLTSQSVVGELRLP